MISKSGGLILLNKPSGITSFKGLNVLKKTLGTGKVGHTGTLDKFADGLIVALFGKMTKLVPEFTGMDKEYIAKIYFGKETDTLDPEGQTLYSAEPPDLIDIEKALPFFIGSIKQIPPHYSAIHIDGKRAYEMVRSGEKFQIPARDIEVYSFKIISYNKPYLIAKIRCSKGTYIRSLARDLALKCHSRAHLVELKRTSVGPFSLDDSVTPEKFDSTIHVINPWNIFDYLQGVDKKIIDDCYRKDIAHGKDSFFKELGNEFHDNREYALFDERKEMLALIKKNTGNFSFRFVC
ncbi:MAG: tRNA pseudouridine(55) synthase TruB [Spirochaetaceae bacterium]|nr:tRNA pseudouridine(55) synthase TruB [Spirochaetaceae bacterium]